MKTAESTPVPGQIAADGDAVVESLITGKPLDPQTRDRIRERGRRLTEEIRQQCGEMAIAAELIRESRDE